MASIRSGDRSVLPDMLRLLDAAGVWLVARATGPERYLEAMVTDRALAGRGVGALLVTDAAARAREAGATQLRTDCWAGSERLVRWYEDHGFVRTEVTLVGGWPAQLLRMAL